MRKITSLFALLLMFAVSAMAQTYVQGAQVTSAAQLVDGGQYVFRVNGGSYITESSTGTTYVAPNAQNSITAEAIFTLWDNGNDTWWVSNGDTGNLWGQLTSTATDGFVPDDGTNPGEWTFNFIGNNVQAQCNGYYINRSSGVMHGWSTGINLQMYEVKIQTDDQTAAYNKAAAWATLIPETVTPLVTDASYYSGNAIITSGDGQGVAGLLDNNTSTFCHTAYSGSGVADPGEDHYLQVNDDAGLSEFILYTYRRTQNSNNRPTQINISASNDGSTWTNVTSLTSNLVKNNYFFSEKIDLGGTYKYVRFTVPTTNSGAKYNDHVFFTYSEFQLLPYSATLEEAAQLMQVNAYDLTGTQIARINAVDTELRSTVVNVTYNVLLGGTVVATTVVEQSKGSAASFPLALQNPFITPGNPSVATVSATDNVVNYNATVTSLPGFEFSTDFATAKWYNMTIRSNKQVSKGSSEPYSNATGATSLQKATDEYQWAFAGNPYNFQIWNKASGAGWTLTKDGDNVVMREGTYGWTLCQNSDGFTLKETGTANNYVNDNASTLKFWNNVNAATDNGSTFRVAEVLTFAQMVATEIKPLFDNAGSNFYLTTAVAAANQSKYEAALVDCDLNTYTELLALITPANMVFPNTGYYRFKSSGNRSIGESYLSYGVDGYYGQTGLVTVEAAQKETNLSTIFKMTKVGDNQYTLSTQGLDVQTVDANDTVFPLGEGSATVFSFVVNAPGIVAVRDINNTETTNNCLHEAGWSAPMGVVRWSSTSDCSQWSVEEADVVSVAMHTADDNKAYATFYAPFDATFTGGVTAYTITRGAAIDGVGSEAVMTEVTGAVPAGTPVVLVDETGTVAAATANVSYGAAALGVENILSGHYLASTVADGSLVFGQYNSVPGFYRYDDYTTVLGANRAYIAPAQANNVRAFVFVSPETGISTTLFNKQNGSTYDLQGRRVQNAQKGLYILNGKKVLVK